MSIKVNRKSIRFNSDPKRVITRFFFPAPETRVHSILHKVDQMPEQAAGLVLNQTLREFAGRHRNVSRIFKKHFKRVVELMDGDIIDMEHLSPTKKLLIGAYFTSEYSIESAAFFNPSMVEDPDQTGLRMGEKRVIISFRATGEGHISSIVFRGGVLDENNHLDIIPTGRLIEEAELIRNYVYDKEEFFSGLTIDSPVVQQLMSVLNREFDYYQLHTAIDERLADKNIDEHTRSLLHRIRAMGDAYYEISFSLDTGISDRVIFPITAEERNGIEDARFVKFMDEDGLTRYYATYTAYNGVDILPRLIETRDFYKFRILPIHGEHIRNKGLALFPRKVNGRYAMLGRIDGVNNYVLYSDHINVWDEAVRIQEPMYPWEFIQVGNCGSPIETPYGWLVITHGVGTMRKYCLGAILLDLNDPTKIIGELTEPLISANEEEREGYVPNVVYSCGSIVNNEELVIPYAMSDTASTYATVSINELLKRLLPSEFTTNQEKHAHKGRVLIVEDEVMSQQVIANILKQAHYEVDVAPDGIAALMKIAKNNFDLILSDISMPNFDGYQLLDFLRQHNINIPVMLLTSYTSELDEVKGLEKGAVEYLRKPVTKDVLLLRIEKVLEKFT
ncbi:putative GH43/DUF377 family glycosyl hydrolase [Chitinophaga skermanii]|uniref:Putative GH43/DUF377 family glycosyl hydrolase n=1 Tax=Chitinophaga skermanii TaxID=331697 RepID=A0A327QIA3_9BACT|nr:response regulator [Chitinophaga skermanii]RAJ04299.1 putative GH43/DUF377 family glycosyl hydrolase [Chitinophaga skermanii]